ncbi:hypothetical protein [Nocardioides sp. zg-1228]|uniref:hypothetical protein n=1 Tax=Nocardioides sp. zg-1228 TaxID=2763008 RepID=UPI0016423680|nr:hypothetical protein [Nocardioides sp. zg-1228]MBC2934123.1 hypothetical protein [Nocardioides sp. zg-1228]QSF58870.1 hypothetical protein JX575_06745 [Nocardioides sp. zg-1228]
MAAPPPPDLLAPFLAAADSAAAARPEVDGELARELMAEAAGRLHDSLALDHLDEHDRTIAVTALAADLVASDPGAAVRSRAAGVEGHAGPHDPDGVRAAYLVAARVLGL